MPYKTPKREEVEAEKEETFELEGFDVEANSGAL